MRVVLCVGFCLLVRAAAGADVPPDQCLGGTLLSAQVNSITTKFNEKVITMPIAPGAEIWRRGMDIQSAQQLVPGDTINLRCTEGTGGQVMASLIVAGTKDQLFEIEPHNIVEIRVCVGRLVAIAKDTLSVKNDQGTCVLHINAETTIWRGETLHDTSALKLGDDIGAWATVDYPGRELTAEYVDANVDHWEGVITKVQKDTIYLKFDKPIKGTGKVIFDDSTDFRSCAFEDLKRDCTPNDLKVGHSLDIIGLLLGERKLRATKVLGIQNRWQDYHHTRTRPG
jgi:hypothetical protein